jgi:ABC-2 type transport system permease protein
MSALSLRRLSSLFLKEMIETFRDWKMLSLTLTFAPFFVVLMYAYFGHVTPIYHVAVVNKDAGAEAPGLGRVVLGRELIAAMTEIRSEDGTQILRIHEADEEEARARVRDRRADLMVVIPPDFSQAIQEFLAGRAFTAAAVTTYGDPANPDYMMAAVWSDMVAYEFVGLAMDVETPVLVQQQTVTGAVSLSDFDLYVPGLLVLAPMMLMFTAAGALIREKDSGTLIRLRLSNMRVVEWLTAVSATQVIVGLLAIGLTYFTAYVLGYRTQGSFTNLLVIGALTSLSVMAFSVGVAAFLRTVFDLVTVGCFPFFVLMFFSGGMFPLPGVSLLSLGSRAIELNEVLPTTHGITALERILNFGAGLGEVGFELGALVFLTAVFFLVGTWIFSRRHMPAVG